jgi:hypothetical protein
MVVVGWGWWLSIHGYMNRGGLGNSKNAASVEHLYLAKLECMNTFRMIWLGESMFVTKLKINEAERQPAQPLGVFQKSRMFQINDCRWLTITMTTTTDNEDDDND